MRQTGAFESVTRRPPVGVAVVVSGVALAVLGWVNLFVYDADAITGRIDFVYEILINGGLALASVVLAYRTLDSEFTDDDVRVVAYWYFGAILFLWALLLWSNLGDLFSGTSPLAYSGSLFALGGLGGLGGLVAGRNRARAQQNLRLLKERERQRKHISEQHTTLEFINRLLRHDVANGLTVIAARSEILTDHDDDEVREHAGVVFERSNQLIDLTERVREFSAALHGDPDPEPIAVSEVVESEVARMRQTYPGAEITVNAPDSVHALAGEFFVSAVANVVENAIEHNDTGRPTVDVSVVADDDEVRVRVADNGPGISEARVEEIVEPPDENTEPIHGVGLSLVETVLTRYGGGLDIEENDPRGTVAVLRLRRAEDGATTDTNRRIANV